MSNFNERINGYFSMIRDICIGYENAKVARQIERAAILEKKNHEHELSSWNEREEKYPFPFSRGQTAAYRAWLESVDNHTNYLECRSLPWPEDIPSFVETLREAGVNCFAITDHSTALLEGIHCLSRNKCSLVSICNVTRNEKRWGGTEETSLPGILMRVNFDKDKEVQVYE